MPDINFGEWIIIGVIAIVVVGPRNLPDLAYKIGGWMREARAMATDFRLGLEREIADLDEVRADLKGLAEEVAKPIREVRDELGSVSQELKPLDWNGPVPKSGPTPADSAEDFKRIHGLAGAGPADEAPVGPAGEAPVGSADEAPVGSADEAPVGPADDAEDIQSQPSAGDATNPTIPSESDPASES